MELYKAVVIGPLEGHSKMVAAIGLLAVTELERDPEHPYRKPQVVVSGKADQVFVENRPAVEDLR